MAAVDELVQSTTGQWMVRPPLHCPRGHRLRTGHVLVGSIPRGEWLCAGVSISVISFA
jgi:hypothetical protein